MTEVAALGLSVEGVRNVDRAASSLDRLAESGNRAGGSSDRLGDASRRSSRDISELSDSSRRASRSVDALSAVARRAASIMVGAFAGVKLANLIQDAALANSRFQQLGVVMEVVGRNVNLSANEVNRYAQEVQAMGISMTESRQTVIRMIQAQMDLSRASELARLAQDAAVIANTNSSDALGRLIYGLQSGQVEILRTMGLNVNFANSYRTLADQMGVAVDQLSEADRAQARMNAVMDAGVQIAGAYEASMDSAAKQLGSTVRYIQDITVLIGGVFSDATVQAVFGYSDALKSVHERAQELAQDGTFERWSSNIAEGMEMAGRAATVLALILVARLASSAASAGAAFLSANAQAIAYQATLARMAGVSTAAAAGQTALAGATRAASGALALVGGPVGAAVVAGGAIFYFREELGLVAPNAEKASSAIQKLTADMDQLSAATARNRKIELEKNLRRAETAVNVLQGSFDHLSADLERRPDNWRVAQQLDKVTEELEQQIKSVAEYRAAIADMDNHIRRVNQGWMSQEEILKRLPPVLDDVTSSADGVAEASGRALNQLQGVVDRYDAVGASTRQLVADHEALRQAVAQGLPGAEKAMERYWQTMVTVERVTSGPSANDLGREQEAFLASIRAEVEAAQRAAEVQIQSVGLGDRARRMYEEQAQIREEFARRISDLTQAQLSEETRMSQESYEAAVEALRSAEQERLDIVLQTNDQIIEAQGDWANGARRALDNYLYSVRNVADSIEEAITGAFRGMEDSLVSFVKGGKLSFRDLANSIIDDMIRIAIQQSITGPLAGWMGSALGGVTAQANGGAWSGGVQRFAAGGAFTNSVVSSPTLFPLGLMGESGPEAIMPLSRGPGGKLGVQAYPSQGGGQGNVIITVNVNEMGAQADVNGQGDAAQVGKDLAQAIQVTVRNELSKAKRQGGMLWRNSGAR